MAVGVLLQLDEFPRLGGETDDSARIARALASARSGRRCRVALPEWVIISSPILCPSGTSLVGGGKSVSVIQLTSSFTGSCVIGLATDETTRVELADFRIDGSGCTGHAVDGIDLTNKDAVWNYDPYHIVRDVMIENMTGRGVYAYGRGETSMQNVRVLSVGGHGFEIRVFDSDFVGLSAGLCGGSAFKVAGGPNRFSACKGWGAGAYGWDIGGRAHSLSACESQQSVGAGLRVTGTLTNIQMVIDSVGWDSSSGSAVQGASAVEVAAGASLNSISAVVCNSVNNSSGHLGSISYALRCESRANHISVVAADVRVAGIHPGSVDQESTYYSVGGSVSVCI